MLHKLVIALVRHLIEFDSFFYGSLLVLDKCKLHFWPTLISSDVKYPAVASWWDQESRLHLLRIPECEYTQQFMVHILLTKLVSKF